MTSSRSTFDGSTSAPWTLDQFVDKLNTQVPLGHAQDARRASAWNPRLVRHYTTSKVLSAPEKLGRQAFYGPQHLDEARRLASLQDAGVSSRSVVMLSSPATDRPAAVQVNALTSDPAPAPDARRQHALALLNGWQGSTVHLNPGAGAAMAATAQAMPLYTTNLMGGGPMESAHTANLMGGDVQGPLASTFTASMEAAPAVRPEQWHRWSPFPGMDVALRDDLWGREDELRQLLNDWAQGPS